MHAAVAGSAQQATLDEGFAGYLHTTLNRIRIAYIQNELRSKATPTTSAKPNKPVHRRRSSKVSVVHGSEGGSPKFVKQRVVRISAV